MLVLESTTDSLEVVTSAAVTVDVVACHMDCTQASPPVFDQPETTPTAITTATTTVIVAAPGGTLRRNVKQVSIRNKHASSSVDITVLLDRSTVNYEILKVTLRAGETLEYQEGIGWFVFANEFKLDVKLRVTADFINATTSFADITGLTYPVESGKFYNFEAHLYHIENAATTGAQFGINGPAMTAMTIQEIGVVIPSLTASSMQSNLGAVTAVNTAAVAATASATTPGVVMAILSGYFNPSAAGTFAVRGASEVAVAAGLTVKAGSWCRLWEADI